jgi:hypothetical protein
LQRAGAFARASPGLVSAGRLKTGNPENFVASQRKLQTFDPMFVRE